MSYHSHRAGHVGDTHYVGDASEDQRANRESRPPALVARVLGDFDGGGRAATNPPRLVTRTLGHYYGSGGLGDDAAKSNLKLAKAGIPASAIAKMNADFANAIKPLSGAIDALGSVLSASQRAELKAAPLTFLFGLFDPIVDVVALAIARVNAKTGKQQRNFFGTAVEMRAFPPADQIFDEHMRNVMRMLRTIQQFMTLLIQDPVKLNVELAGAALEAGLKFARIDLNSSTLARTTPENTVLFRASVPVGGGRTREFQFTQAQVNALPMIDAATETALRAATPKREIFSSHPATFSAPPVGSFKVYWFHRDGEPVFVRRVQPGTATGPRAVSGLGAAGEEAAVVPTAEAVGAALALTGVPVLDALIGGLVLTATGAATTIVGVGTTRFVSGQDIFSGATLTPKPGVPVKVNPLPGPVVNQGGGEQPTEGVSPVVIVAGAAAVVFLALSLMKKKGKG